MKLGLSLCLLALGFGCALPTPARAAEDTATAPTAGAVFPIYEFEVDGNSVLSVTAVEQALSAFLGESRSFDEVEKARDALEKAYQRAGYLSVLVDIPEQQVSDGLVRLQVIEGRVAHLYVTGSRYYDQGAIRAALDQVEPGQVPDFNQLQKQIATINRDERQVQPVLRPGRLPGTVDVEIKVNDKLPLGGTVELNNGHAANTVPWRLQASLRYDNLFQRDHSIGLTLITAPQAPKQAGVLILNYGVPLGEGLVWTASLVASDSTLEPLGASTVIGKGTTIASHWLQSVASAGASHALGYGLSVKHLQERNGVAGANLISTPIRYLPFDVSYSGAWDGAATQTSFNTSLTAATRSLLSRQIDCPDFVGASYRSDQFACKRQGADGSFAAWRADLRFSAIAPALGTLALRLAGQLASAALVSSEQFAIGGADTVRGYFDAEASGDNALLASVEWRSPDLLRSLLDQVAAGNGLNAIAFVDAAKSHTLQPAAGQPSSVGLAGAGIGLRLSAGNGLRADLDLAWPLRATTLTATSEPRLHARLVARF
jgi:hemolysin activation/secretion protein